MLFPATSCVFKSDPGHYPVGTGDGKRMPDQSWNELRELMVQVVSLHAEIVGDVTGRPRLDERVLAALAEVPRHEFVPGDIREHAYADGPLPIGCDKTISQPFICALMTDLLRLEPEHRVLEVGTGLGYHAALLSRLCRHVHTVEIVQELAELAMERLGRLGHRNVELRVGNGWSGWEERAPFDRILVAAAAEQVPPRLLEQLSPGGILVMPLGPADEAQQLAVVTHPDTGGTQLREVLPVRFAPLERAH